MYATLVAIVCTLVGPDVSACTEEVVSDTWQDSNLTFTACLKVYEPGLVEWLKHNPKYHNATLRGWKCIPGRYEPPHRA